MNSLPTSWMLLAIAALLSWNFVASLKKSQKSFGVTPNTKILSADYYKKLGATFEGNSKLKIPTSQLKKATNQAHAKRHLEENGIISSDSSEDSTGWLYEYYYTGSQCGGEDFYFTRGVATNICLNSESYGQKYSSLYSCYDGYAFIYQFSGVDCQNYVTTSEIYLDCGTPYNYTTLTYTYQNGTVDDDSLPTVDDDASFNYYYTELQCQEYDSKLYLDDEFYLQELFLSDDCSYPIYFNGSANDKCFYRSDTRSYYLSVPYYYVYHNPDCSGEPHGVGDVPNSNTCDSSSTRELVTLAATDDAVALYDYHKFSLTNEVDGYSGDIPTSEPVLEPTSEPVISQTPSLATTGYPTLTTYPTTIKPSSAPTTLRPSRKPTNRPSTIAPSSKVQTSVSFNVTQGYSGINQTVYLQNTAINNEVIADTVASLLKGVYPSNVNVYSVSAPTSTTATKKLLSSTLDISYSITCKDISAAGYSSAKSAYSSLTTSLDDSIKSGAFTSTMQSYATDAGSTELASATGLSATYSDYTSSTVTYGSSDDDDSHRLSDGAIAGIVIGSVVGAAILLGIAYYLYITHNSDSTATTGLATAQAVPDPERQAQTKEKETEEDIGRASAGDKRLSAAAAAGDDKATHKLSPIREPKKVHPDEEAGETVSPIPSSAKASSARAAAKASETEGETHSPISGKK